MDRRQFTIGAATAVSAGLVARSGYAQPAPAAATPAAKPPVPAASKPLPSAVDPARLKPGQFEWRPSLAPEGSVVFIVSLPEQIIHVYRNGVRIGVSTCSTGKPGYRTPAGVFVILQKNKDHYSSTYNNAPMPNMQRLTWRGVALHAGNLPGYPASHGCVRLPKKFSEHIFGITTLGVPVIIADAKSQPEVVVHPGLLLPSEAEKVASEAMTEAAKARTAKDVMSAVVSHTDRRALLLIDGKVIWESEIDIVDPRKPFGDHAFTLLGPAPEGGTYRWMANDFRRPSREVVGKRDGVLSRIKVKKLEEQRQYLAAAKGHPTLVVTDRPAGIKTRTDNDFVIADALVS
jgi:lipoprotein-anchoring transpeptidase ErfK/SrfK